MAQKGHLPGGARVPPMDTTCLMAGATSGPPRMAVATLVRGEEAVDVEIYGQRKVLEPGRIVSVKR